MIKPFVYTFRVEYMIAPQFNTISGLNILANATYIFNFLKVLNFGEFRLSQSFLAKFASCNTNRIVTFVVFFIGIIIYHVLEVRFHKMLTIRERIRMRVKWVFPSVVKRGPLLFWKRNTSLGRSLFYWQKSSWSRPLSHENPTSAHA